MELHSDWNLVLKRDHQLGCLMEHYLVGLTGFHLVASFLMVTQKAPEMGSMRNLDSHLAQ